MIRLESVSKTYAANGRPVAALRDASLTVEAGQFCAVRGKSGCGKSTLLLAAGGLLRPDTGRVWLQDQDLYAMPAERRAARRADSIGFVFQQFHLVPYLNVRDNILAALLGRSASSDPDARQRAMTLIEQFGLTDRIRHRPGQLSTGERQRTALARALLNQPRVLLADEPTGNLDDENSRIVLQCLDAFAREGGAVLLATHDRRAAELAHHTIAMHDGQLVPDN